MVASLVFRRRPFFRPTSGGTLTRLSARARVAAGVATHSPSCTPGGKLAATPMTRVEDEGVGEGKQPRGLLGAALGGLAGGTMGSQIEIKVLGSVDEALPMALVGMLLGAAVEGIIMAIRKVMGRARERTGHSPWYRRRRAIRTTPPRSRSRS